MRGPASKDVRDHAQRSRASEAKCSHACDSSRTRRQKKKSVSLWHNVSLPSLLCQTDKAFGANNHVVQDRDPAQSSHLPQPLG